MHRTRRVCALFLTVFAMLLLTLSAAAACEEHWMDEGVVTIEPTCSTIGIITYTCQNQDCDYSYTEKIGILEHPYTSGEEETDAATEPAPETPAETEPETTGPITILNTGRPLSGMTQQTKTAISFNVMAAGAKTADEGEPVLLALLLGMSLGGIVFGESGPRRSSSDTKNPT